MMLEHKARFPIAVLLFPVVLKVKAPFHIAVL